MTNRYTATCRRCHKTVQPGDGFTMGKPGAWETEHNACTPKVGTTPTTSENGK